MNEGEIRMLAQLKALEAEMYAELVVVEGMKANDRTTNCPYTESTYNARADRLSALAKQFRNTI